MFFWAASTPILSFTTLSPSINFDDAVNAADESDDGGDDNDDGSDDNDDDDDDDDDGGNQREGRTRITLVLHTMPQRWLNKEDFNTMHNHRCLWHHHHHHICHQQHNNQLILNDLLCLKITL